MATSITTPNTRTLFMKRVLQSDGVLDGLVGIISLVGAGPLTALIGLPTPVILVALGVVLLLFSLSLFWLSTQQPINERVVLLYGIGNIACAFAAVILLVDSGLFTVEGKWIIGLAIVAVDTIGVFELYSVWRQK